MSTALVEQIYTGCLAHAAYIIVSDGEAAVIDPLRDPKPYIEFCEKQNAKIKYVIETHFHADFVSGHVDLAKATGATIVYGPTAAPTFEAFIAKDNEVLPLGKHKFTVMHTPGHTMESTTYLLHKEDGAPHCIFTGDTLFIGDAGRPDLAQKAASMTQEQLAALLYKSLRRIMTLPDDVIVYPGHGAGSACGKNMSSETFDLLGKQKMTNYTLRADQTEEEFIKELLDGLRAPPGYFGTQVAMNKGQVESHVEYSEVMNRGLTKLSVETVKAKLAEGVLVLDCRHLPAEFCAGFIPKSVFAGTIGSLAVWVATVFADVHQPYVLVASDANLIEAVSRLARVGFNNCLGHLDGGIEAWKAAGEPLQTIDNVPPSEAAAAYVKDKDSVYICDVRGPGEYNNYHIKGANSTPLCSREPLDFAGMASAGQGKKMLAHCAGGYRSVMFISLARRAGVEMANIDGGWGAMMEVPDFKANVEERA